MRIAKYIPDRMIGFVNDQDAGPDVYFHLGDFDPKGPWPNLGHDCPRSRMLSFNWESPPPILGEPVEVTFHGGPTNGKAPRAQRVVRVVAPVHLRGTVESFDPRKGYGFVRGDDGVTYYLHRSEMTDQHMPYVGSSVMFFAGSRQGKPRSVHVHTCGES